MTGGGAGTPLLVWGCLGHWLWAPCSFRAVGSWCFLPRGHFWPEHVITLKALARAAVRIVTAPHHCILSLMSPNLLPSLWDLLDFAQPFGGHCFSTPKSFTASMLSILKWERWQAGVPLGFPAMQGGCGGGLEMETVTCCAAIVHPQHPGMGTVAVPAPNPWDITLM